MPTRLLNGSAKRASLFPSVTVGTDCAETVEVTAARMTEVRIDRMDRSEK
jgi:hypothetical protein